LYQAALTDYEYTQYRAGNTDNGMFSNKLQELKQFFAKSPAAEKDRDN